MDRFFSTNIFPDRGEIIINGEDAFHIASVLRMSNGDNIVVCDGKMNDYVCEISALSKSQVTARIISSTKNVAEPKTNITLFQALPKADKMDFIIQKSVELGVCRIVPVLTEFTVSRPKDTKSIEHKMKRFRKICESAAKQSGRGIIPEISDIVSFKDGVSIIKQLSLPIAAYERERKNSFKDILPNFKGKSLGIFIGPEGGFSGNEVQAFIENDIHCVTLGPRILRTETAGICALSIINYELEEYSHED